MHLANISFFIYQDTINLSAEKQNRLNEKSFSSSFEQPQLFYEPSYLSSRRNLMLFLPRTVACRILVSQSPHPNRSQREINRSEAEHDLEIGCLSP
jgi:hypothetical protein